MGEKTTARRKTLLPNSRPLSHDSLQPDSLLRGFQLSTSNESYRRRLGWILVGLLLLGSGCGGDRNGVIVVNDSLHEQKEDEHTFDIKTSDYNEEQTCRSECGDFECGPDPAGCIESCGQCPEEKSCDSGVCVCPEGVECNSSCCLPGEICWNDSCCMLNCSGKECGDDGCGGTCGVCGNLEECSPEGLCVPLACGGVACPEHPQEGRIAYCNPQEYCEYVNPEGSGWDIEIFIPPSSFPMGLSADACPGESSIVEMVCSSAGPLHSVSFEEGFFIDKYEATLGQYNDCLLEGICEELEACPNTSSCCAEDGSNIYDNMSLDSPVVCVGKIDAEMFCDWLGKELPSEAEWERAAKGTEDRLWVWGAEPEPNCEQAVCCECGDSYAQPVGSSTLDVSAVGAFDMAGNVNEFVADCWHGSYVGAPDDGGIWDWDCEEEDSHTVKRGGCWKTAAVFLFAAARSSTPPGPSGTGGFRCVRKF